MINHCIYLHLKKIISYSKARFENKSTNINACCFFSHMCRPDFRKATSYFDPHKKKYVQPDWIDAANGGLEYSPSTNVAPTEILPVLISNTHEKIRPSEDLSTRIIKPMMWGMIPFWHKVIKENMV